MSNANGSQQRKVGAIIIGTGFGVLTHLRALRIAGIEVRALVGRDPEKTAHRAKLSDVPLALTSLEEALALPDVDIVTIATPPHTHHEITLAAVAAGKHIYCEKPFARNIEEAREMQAAAEAAGVLNLVGMEFRMAEGQAFASRLIREGKIGQPKIATFMMHVPVLADPEGEVPDWWSKEEEGGGWLGAYCSHIIDQIRSTVGEITGLSASLALVADRDWSAEDSYTIHFRTESGCDGVMQSTAGAWGPIVYAARFAGPGGTLWLEGETVKIADKNGTQKLETPDDLKTVEPQSPPAELMHTAYDHLHLAGFDIGPCTKAFEYMRDHVLSGATTPALVDPAPATFADGVKCQQILDAIRKSSAEHCWVNID